MSRALTWQNDHIPLDLHLTVTGHALMRYNHRVGPISTSGLARLIRRPLILALRMGARTDGNLGVHLEIEPGVIGVVTPSEMGGWSLVTVYRRGEEGEE